MQIQPTPPFIVLIQNYTVGGSILPLNTLENTTSLGELLKRSPAYTAGDIAFFMYLITYVVFSTIFLLLGKGPKRFASMLAAIAFAVPISLIFATSPSTIPVVAFGSVVASAVPLIVSRGNGWREFLTNSLIAGIPALPAIVAALRLYDIVGGYYYVPAVLFSIILLTWAVSTMFIITFRAILKPKYDNKYAIIATLAYFVFSALVYILSLAVLVPAIIDAVVFRVIDTTASIVVNLVYVEVFMLMTMLDVLMIWILLSSLRIVRPVPVAVKNFMVFALSVGASLIVYFVSASLANFLFK